MSDLRSYSASRIFTGETWLQCHTVLVENDKIIDVIDSSSLKTDAIQEDYPDHWLVPAFIDLQIYGAHGKLLAVYPEADSLFKLSEYCAGGGAAYCLPTVATNTYDVFYNCIDAVRDYWTRGGKGVLGLHIEGPWIHPAKKGAHIESLIHSPKPDDVRKLLDYGKGVIKIITLAPEVCSREVIDIIISYGVIISAGHSNASYKQAIEAFAGGITVATHLYNAMSPLQHREPGLVGACFDHKTVRASIIPDGYHVDYAAIRIAKQLMKERLFVITDAVTETEGGYYPHEREGDKYVSSGILSGSALTINKAIQNLVRYADIDLDEALRMCSLYPARVMGMENELGRIARGYRANMAIIDEKIEVKGMIG